jgi:rod shape-determining protein MreC
MVRRVNTYKRFLYLFLILSLIVILISPEFQKKPIQWIQLPVGGAIYYIQEGTYSVMNRIAGIWHGYINLIHVQEENKTLHRTIEELKGENNLLKEQGALAERLQAMLEYKKSSPHQLTAAEVIGREPSHWFKSVIINKGEAEGVRVDMGVMTPQGVVGKVIKTESHYSQVLLMTDRNSAVAAMIQRTRDEGIVQGVEKGAIRLKYLPHFSEVSVGDVVVTSGLEGSFTKGLKIGQVETIEKKEHELFLEVKLAPEIDFYKLEEVFVITSVGHQDGLNEPHPALEKTR